MTLPLNIHPLKYINITLFIKYNNHILHASGKCTQFWVHTWLSIKNRTSRRLDQRRKKATITAWNAGECIRKYNNCSAFLDWKSKYYHVVLTWPSKRKTGGLVFVERPKSNGNAIDRNGFTESNFHTDVIKTMTMRYNCSETVDAISRTFRHGPGETFSRKYRKVNGVRGNHHVKLKPRLRLSSLPPVERAPRVVYATCNNDMMITRRRRVHDFITRPCDYACRTITPPLLWRPCTVWRR